MNKDIKRILWVTGLYSFAGGIFYNFIELWLLGNGFNTSEVSFIYSIGALVTAIGIMVFSYVIKQKNIQNFALGLLIIKAIIFYLMYQINGMGFKSIISILFIIDFVIDTEIYILLYPMISSIKKDDKLYATRGLTYEAFYYIAFFISGMLIGKKLLTYNFTYNSYAIIGTFILFVSVVILLDVDLDKYIKKSKKTIAFSNVIDKLDSKSKKTINNSTSSLIKALKDIKKDKVSILYLLFLFFTNISRFCILAFTMIIFTKYLNFESGFASNLRLVFNIASVLLASIALRKLTFKNNYINIFIKYGIRAILYLVALLYFNNTTLLIAIAYTLISISSYTHAIDAPYINRYEKDEQIAFLNVREVINYISRAIGYLVCGLCIAVSLKMNLLVSLMFSLISITFACTASYYINKK